MDNASASSSVDSTSSRFNDLTDTVTQLVAVLKQNQVKTVSGIIVTELTPVQQGQSTQASSSDISKDVDKLIDKSYYEIIVKGQEKKQK